MKELADIDIYNQIFNAISFQFLKIDFKFDINIYINHSQAMKNIQK